MSIRRFNQAQINEIRTKYTFHGPMNLVALSEKYKVDRSTIYSVIHGRGTYGKMLCSHCGSLVDKKQAEKRR